MRIDVRSITMHRRPRAVAAMPAPRARGRSLPRIAAVLALAALPLSSAGCGGGATESEAAAAPLPNRFEFGAEAREWYDIYHVETQGQIRQRRHVGYAYRQIRGEDRVTYVLDLKNDEIGFLLKDDRAFRFKPSLDSSGKLARDTEEIGYRGYEGGVQAILGLAGGAVEVVQVNETRPPDALRESSAGAATPSSSSTTTSGDGDN